MAVVLQETATLDGINVAGYLTAESGVGAAARGYVKALQKLNMQVALNNVDIGVQSRKADDTFAEFAANNPYPINLICVNADQVPAFMEAKGADYFAGKYNIGVWWWETPDFPEEWLQSFDRFDEIWVGSSYIQRAISRLSPVPVVLIPPVVLATELYADKTRFGLDTDEFTFLSVFDFFSNFERKNPLATIDAFTKAFRRDEPVRLVLKCINVEAHPERFATLKESAKDARIAIIDRYLSSRENLLLIRSCDAYVSLHRAEGLGLPIAESMLQKRPVIVTAWSGNMDFTNINNSFLVPYKLIANGVEAKPYKMSDYWAEPDIDQAAALLRTVVDQAERRNRLLEQAFIDASSHFGCDSVAQLIQNRLTVIKAFNRVPEETMSKSPCYVDKLTEERLQIIERGNSNTVAKSVLRKVMMPLVEKSGYLNSVYAALFRKLATDSAHAEASVQIMDGRMRRALADADTRIAMLEKKVAELSKNGAD